MKYIFKILLFIIVFLLALGFTISNVEAKKAKVGFEISAEYEMIISIKKPMSKHLMIHAWYMPNKETDILFGYTFSGFGFKQLDIRIGPAWSQKNEDEMHKIRTISSELAFELPIGGKILLESYNLLQLSITDPDNNSLLRYNIKLLNADLVKPISLATEFRLEKNTTSVFYLGGSYSSSSMTMTLGFNIHDVTENIARLTISF